jgi:hypothetical protein
VVLDPSFLSMMPETISVYPSTSTDSYGKVTYSGTAVETRAYVQETGRVVKTADNRDVYEEGKVIFYGNPVITTESKMVLPSGKIPLIISIREYTDESFPQITIVSFGSS